MQALGKWKENEKTIPGQWTAITKMPREKKKKHKICLRILTTPV